MTLRTRATALLLLAVALMVLKPMPVAVAACTWKQVAHYSNGVLVYDAVKVCTGSSQAGSDQGSSPVSQMGTETCVGAAAVLSLSYEDFCTFEEDPPGITPGLLRNAMRRMSFPASRIVVEPPNGRTLVNFPTNFYTRTAPFERSADVLGQRVDFRISPAWFTWHFDDGKSATTTKPGAPYPELLVTHEYMEKGNVSPSVDTTYTADFRVNGGAWQPVPGSVTIDGEPVSLEVVEASPILVGYG